MTRSFRSLAAVASLLPIFGASTLLAADQPNPAEARLREALRGTMLQLRDAQTQVATLQAEKAEMEQKNTTLTGQVEALGKQMTADKEEADKKIADLDAQVVKHEKRLAEMEEALEKWKEAYQKMSQVAGAKESERAKLAAEAIRLQRIVDDQKRKNAEMFQIGNEILTRYQKFGLGTALTAREPFVGTTRVKLQNLVQDYEDKLLDQRIKP